MQFGKRGGGRGVEKTPTCLKSNHSTALFPVGRILENSLMDHTLLQLNVIAQRTKVRVFGR